MFSRGTLLVLLVLTMTVVAACAGGATKTPAPNVVPPPAPTLPSDALSQMEIAFIGTPRQAEIRELLEPAFEIYDLEWTEDNLSRAGSTLVALRQDAETAGRDNVTETAILEAMVADGGLPGMTFPEAAGWIAAALRLE